MLSDSEVFIELLDVMIRQLKRIFFLLVGAHDNLVVHIGVIHHMAHFKPSILEETPDDIEYQRRHSMTDVGFIVHSWAAHIHTHKARRDCLQRFLPAGRGVVNANGHSIALTFSINSFSLQRCRATGFPQGGRKSSDPLQSGGLWLR